MWLASAKLGIVILMKILHIGKYYPPFAGGIENFMAELLPLLSPEKHTVCALVHDHSSGKLAQEETINQVKIIRVPSYGRLLYAPVSPAFGIYLQRTLKTFKPDIIHIHMPNVSAFWLLFSSLAKKVPWVIHWHSDVIGSAPNKLVAYAYHFYQFFEFSLLKKSAQIIATSPNYRQSSSVLKPWLDKTQIIPLGLAQNQIHITNSSKQYAAQLWSNDKYRGNNQHRILTIGRLSYYKGHKYLIEAMQDLPESQLIIVGQGEEYHSLQTLIERLNLKKRVLLTGKLAHSDLHALLESCHIFCLPSIERTEAFGLVLLEAMYYAKPTIVSDIPGSGMTWVCQNNKTGLLSKPGDNDDIAEKIQLLQNNKNLAQQYGQMAAERLQQEFSLEVVARKTLQLYTKTLNGST